jgi:hypothetical protein
LPIQDQSAHTFGQFQGLDDVSSKSALISLASADFEAKEEEGPTSMKQLFRTLTLTAILQVICRRILGILHVAPSYIVFERREMLTYLWSPTRSLASIGSAHQG